MDATVNGQQPTAESLRTDATKLLRQGKHTDAVLRLARRWK